MRSAENLIEGAESTGWGGTLACPAGPLSEERLRSGEREEASPWSFLSLRAVQHIILLLISSSRVPQHSKRRFRVPRQETQCLVITKFPGIGWPNLLSNPPCFSGDFLKSLPSVIRLPQILPRCSSSLNSWCASLALPASATLEHTIVFSVHYVCDSGLIIG